MTIFASVRSDASSEREIAESLLQSIGAPPAVLTLFFAESRKEADVVQHLSARWPDTKIIGCSTSGEISTGKLSKGSVVAGALGSGLVGRSAVALAQFQDGVGAGIKSAVAQLEAQLGSPLASLDPKVFLGLVFVDSNHGKEEEALHELGSHAPLMTFVGGSAGDDMAFKTTRALVGAESTSSGCSLAILELLRPYHLVRLCHLQTTGIHHRVTKTEGRLLLELDHRPAAEAYAAFLNLPTAELTLSRLAAAPAGILIEGQPWVRQVSPPGLERGGVVLGCEVRVGQTLHFLEPATGLVPQFSTTLAATRRVLGDVKGALMFDCVLRRRELKLTDQLLAYQKEIDFPAAGFQSHGEFFVGHMHQTLTAVFFG